MRISLLALLLAMGPPVVQADERPRKPAADEAAVRAPEPALEGNLAGVTVKNRRYGMHLIRARSRNVPKVGEQAPDFTLQTFDGKRKLSLASLQGAKPVVLLFGSLT